MANAENPPLCSGVAAAQSRPKSHAFTVIRLGQFLDPFNFRLKASQAIANSIPKFDDKLPINEPFTFILEALSKLYMSAISGSNVRNVSSF